MGQLPTVPNTQYMPNLALAKASVQGLTNVQNNINVKTVQLLNKKPLLTQLNN